MKIYVFGNPLIKEDSRPLKLIRKLKKKFPEIKFVAADPNENFPPKGEKELVILDAVKGIKEPMILNLDDFNPPAGGKTPISPHDYDLLFHLLLLKKLKKINRVTIIGIPTKFNPNRLVNYLHLTFKKWAAQDMQGSKARRNFSTS